MKRQPKDAPLASRKTERPVAFVEDKQPDFVRVADYLKLSARERRWANFGPVWSVLKARIESMLALPADRSAIPCASGTHALAAAAALAERNGSLRWLSPDYAFRATAIGPFADARFIDCNQHGALDADLLGRFDETSYDGVVVLNPFGLLRSLSRVVDHTRQLGKALIIDNAMGLIGFDRNDHAGVFECISLHHTKPFGFGEGGCLIVDRDQEEDAKRALDFGNGWPWPGGRSCLSNGKLSEPAAAFIVDRLDRAAEFTADYRLQFERIRAIAEGHGFRLLVDPEDVGEAVPGNVPLLAQQPISLVKAQNNLVTIAKYYRPITGRTMAMEIFSKIINVPCHPGMAQLSDEQLSGLFERWGGL